MNIQLKDFQNDAIYGIGVSSHTPQEAGLVDSICSFLDKNIETLFFQAPTGAGKTIIMANAIKGVLEREPEIAILWVSIANGQLHRQSYDTVFSIVNKVNCHIFSPEERIEEIENSNIYFISMNAAKMDNTYLNIDDEQGRVGLEGLITNFRTTNPNSKILLIIDEAHIADETQKSNELVAKLSPNLTLRMSATLINPDITKLISVDINRVVEAQLLRKGMLVNHSTNIPPGNEGLVLEALNLQETLIKNGCGYLPLVLIQIGNDNKEGETKRLEETLQIIDKVITTNNLNITNGEISYYLSSQKDLDTPEYSNTKHKILIFKEGVSTGWNCPRAQILVRLKDFNPKNDTYNTQLFGRILRAYNGKHYDNQPVDIDNITPQQKLIDYGYIFTDDNELNVKGSVLKIMEGSEKKITNQLKNNLTPTTLSACFIKHTKNGLSNNSLEIVESIILNPTITSIVNTNTQILTNTISQGGVTTQNIHDNNVSVVNSVTTVNALQNSRKNLYSIFQDLLKDSCSVKFFNLALESLLSLSVNTKSIRNEDFVNQVINNVLTNEGVFRNEINNIINTKQINTHLYTTNKINFEYSPPLQETYSDSLYAKEVINNYAYDKPLFYKFESKPEEEMNKILKANKNIEFWLKNRTEPNVSFSLIRSYNDRNNKPQTENFFPDYIIKTKKGFTVILETKDTQSLIDAMSNMSYDTLLNYSDISAKIIGIFGVFNGKDFIIHYKDNGVIQQVQSSTFFQNSCFF